jgi:hypothetical protein
LFFLGGRGLFFMIMLCSAEVWDAICFSFFLFHWQLGHILKLSKKNVAAIYIATKRFSNFRSIDFSSTPEVNCFKVPFIGLWLLIWAIFSGGG